MSKLIHPKLVRYIKLGREGGWEKECLEKGIIRFGFGSASPERLPMCRAGDWAALTKSFVAQGKDKGTATRHTNETRLFFEDDGTTLWITFVELNLWWGFLDPSPAERHSDDDGCMRSVRGAGGALTLTVRN